MDETSPNAKLVPHPTTFLPKYLLEKTRGQVLEEGYSTTYYTTETWHSQQSQADARNTQLRRLSVLGYEMLEHSGGDALSRKRSDTSSTSHQASPSGGSPHGQPTTLIREESGSTVPEESDGGLGAGKVADDGAAGAAETGGTNAYASPHDRYPELCTTVGAVAVIEIQGYSDIISTLQARGNASCSLIKRIMENRYNTIVEILTSFGGDVVGFVEDRVIACWKVHERMGNAMARLPGGEGKRDFRLDLGDAMSEITLSAILACITCMTDLNRRFLNALENINSEFQGFKLSVHCGLGTGNFSDTQIGAEELRVLHFISGQAFRRAMFSLRHPANHTDMCLLLTEGEWRIVSGNMADASIQATPVPESDYLTLSHDRDAIAPYCELLRSRVATNDEQYHTFSSPKFFQHIEQFVHDLAALQMRIFSNKNDISEELQKNWRKASLLTVRLCHKPESAKVVSPGASETNAHLVFWKLVQSAFLILYKHARYFGLNIWKAMKTLDGSVCLLCLAGPSPLLEKNQEAAAVKTAVAVRSALAKTHSRTLDFSYAITTGTAYVGLLATAKRSEYRIVGNFLNEGIVLAGQRSRNQAIVTDLATFNGIRNSALQHYFADAGSFTETQYFYIQQYDFAPKLFTYVPSKRFAHTYKKHASRHGTKDLLHYEGVSGTVEKHKVQIILENCMQNCTKEVLLVEEEAGIGKTKFLGYVKSTANSIGYAVCTARANEAEIYSTPIHTMSVLFFQLCDLINTQSNDSGSKDSTGVVGSGNWKGGGAGPKSGSEKVSKNRRKPRTGPSSKPGEESNVSAKHPSFGSLSNLVDQLRRAKDRKVSPESPPLSYSAAVKQSRVLQRVREALARIGEDVEMCLPILNALLPEDVEGYSSQMTPSAYINMHTAHDHKMAALADLLVRLVNSCCELKPICLIIDDAQWMDSVSWQILIYMARRCDKLVITLACTPLKDFRISALLTMKLVGSVQQLRIKKLAPEHAEQLMMDRYPGMFCKIHPDLLEVVVERSHSLPLLAEVIMGHLLSGDTLIVKDGELTSVLPIPQLLSSIPVSLNECILLQYDMLQSKEFQLLLRIAATVGTTFSLEEVSYVFKSSPEPYQQERIRSSLECLDFFGFLRSAKQSEEMSNVSEFGEPYTFANKRIRDLVYNYRVSEKERRGWHSKLVRFYEARITASTEVFFVPKICYHISVSHHSDRASTMKRLRYLVMFGKYMLLVAQSYYEGRKIWMDILSQLQKHNLNQELDPNSIAFWYVKASKSFSYGMPKEVNRFKGSEFLHASFPYVNLSWPASESQRAKIRFKEYTQLAFRQLYLGLNLASVSRFVERLRANESNNFFRSFMSVWKARKGNLVTATNMDYDKWAITDLILGHFRFLLFEAGAPLLDQISCAVASLNVAYYDACNVALVRARLQSFHALYYWYQNQRTLARFFFQRSLSSKAKDVGEDPIIQVNTIKFLTLSGNWETAIRRCRSTKLLCHQHGYQHGWLVSVGHKVFLLIVDGRFAEALSTLLYMEEESKLWNYKEAFIFSQVVIAQLHILRGQYEYARKVNAPAEEFYNSAPAYLKSICLSLVAYLKFEEGDFGAGLLSIERQAEVLSTMDKQDHDFLIFHGVIMSTLLLFRSIDLYSMDAQHSPAFNSSGRAVPASNTPAPGASPTSKPGSPSITFMSGSDEGDVTRSNEHREEFNLAKISNVIRKLRFALSLYRANLITVPLTLVLRALAVHSSGVARSSEASALLKMAMRRIEGYKESSMRFLYGIIAFKCWKCSSEGTVVYEAALASAQQTFHRLGLEECLEVL